MLKRIFFLLLLSLCIPMSLNWADLDTSPPDPGSPLDWSLWAPGNTTPIREAELSGMGGEKKDIDEPDAVDPDATAAMDVDSLIEKVSQSNNFRITLDPWVQSRVINVDVPIHCPWYGDDNSSGAVGPQGAEPDPISTGYKPDVTRAYRSKLLGQFVRMYVYPDAEPIPEVVNQMVEIGQAAYFAVHAIDKTPQAWNNGTKYGESITRLTAKAVLDSLGDLAGPLPEAEKGDTEFETFLNRALIQELGNGYPHDFDPTFGHRILDLGEVMFPKLVEAALHHPHQLVRRNAVYLLRFYPQIEATNTLRTVLAGKDRVARNRALIALLKRKDKIITPFLLKAMNDKDDYYFQHFAVYALGGLAHGSEEVEKEILLWIDNAIKTKDKTIIGEAYFSAAAALARMGASSNGTMKFYAVVMDRWGVRTHPTHQLALLGKATSGRSKDAIIEIERFIKGRSINVFHLSTVGVALDAFHILDAKAKRNLLRPIAFHKNLDVMVRFNAARLTDFQPKESKLLARFVQNRNSHPIIKALSLLKLWELDPPKAKKLAFDILDTYIKHKNPTNLIGGAEYKIIVSLQMLGPNKHASYEQLTKVLNQALYTAEKQKKIKKQNKNTRVQFVRAPVFQTAIMELARLGDVRAITDLQKLLLNQKLPGRPEAARALMSMAMNDELDEKYKLEVIETLVKVLADFNNPWVRYYAADGLRKITDYNVDCDWVYGSKGQIQKAIRDWKIWFTETIKPRIKELQEAADEE